MQPKIHPKLTALLNSNWFFIFLVVAGVLAGLIAGLSGPDNFGGVRHYRTASVAFLGVLLLFCLFNFIRSLRLKQAGRSLVHGAAGSIALVLGMLLRELVPNNKVVTGIVVLLWAASITISIRTIFTGKRDEERARLAGLSASK